MAKFNVYVDLTVSSFLEVDAENEEVAKKKALENVRIDPYFYIRKGTWVSTEVDQVDKEE